MTTAMTTDISLQNFETDLIQASMTQPVLLDIWAPWCGPCKALGPVLEKLETAYAGRFKLAKLNADEQGEISGQLSEMFGVRSIPFCVMFKDGQPVDGFVGALPEDQIRTFLDKHVPAAEEAEDEVLEAEQPLAEDDPATALEKLQGAVALNPANDAARSDYLRALLSQGMLTEARRVFDPVAHPVVPDARLTACGHWLAALEAMPVDVHALNATLATNKRDFEARFKLAQSHFAAQRFTQAMDQLLEIVMRDKEWSAQLARKNYVAILELMTKPAPKPSKAEAAAPKGTLELAGKINTAPSDPVVDAYRRKLSMALF
jgi:putative thioredoxin